MFTAGDRDRTFVTSLPTRGNPASLFLGGLIIESYSISPSNINLVIPLLFVFPNYKAFQVITVSSTISITSA